MQENATDEVRRPLWYRWFIEYNPLYIASALCVLAGVYLLSGRARSTGGELWLSATIEAYQLLLIAGAALLYRVTRQRRPAVILALVEVVYLADVTLRGEVACLADAGPLISALSVALFAAKLRGLLWALRLRASASAWVALTLGAVALATLPHLLTSRVLDGSLAASVASGTLFGLAAIVLWTRPTIASEDRLEEWGAKVLHRAVRAAWLIWGAALFGHAALWSTALRLPLALMLVVVPSLLTALRARREAGVWCGTAAALVICNWCQPAVLSTTALMAASVLGLRGWRGLQVSRDLSSTAACDPYRRSARLDPEKHAQWVPHLARMYVGAVVCLHLALWTISWRGGPLPPHEMWIDVPTAAILLCLVVRRRSWIGALALLGGAAHFAVQRGLLVAPQSDAGWGMLALAAGFSTLIIGIAISWALTFGGLRRAPDRDTSP